MNVPLMAQTSVALTHCVPTLKDPTSVAVLMVSRETEETAQVKIQLTNFHSVNVKKEKNIFILSPAHLL